MPRSPLRRPLVLVAALAAGWLPARLAADDWPGWRGPRGDGVWRETGIVRAFPAGGPAVVWRVPIGPGYAGPSVAGGRVYCADRDAARETERVVCVDAATGKQLWSHAWEAPYRGVDYTAGPRATPLVHDGRVHALGTMGHLFCLDAATGAVLWKKDLAREYAARIPGWGISAAPIIEGELLIVLAGGSPAACVVAFDRSSGEERWKAVEDSPAYSPPVVIEAGGRRQLIQWTGRNVISLDPSTGAESWKVPFRSRYDLAVMTPVRHGDFLFVSSFYGGALLLDLDRERPGAKVRWQSERADERDTKIIHCLMSTPEVRGDILYGVDSYGQLRAIQLETGKRLWETVQPTGHDRWSNAHLVPNGDVTFLWNERGELIIARLEPAGYSELGRARLLEPTVGSEGLRPVTWAHPAFAGKRIFARNDREMVCASLEAP